MVMYIAQDGFLHPLGTGRAMLTLHNRKETPLGERKSWCQPLISFVNLLATVCRISSKRDQEHHLKICHVAPTSCGNILG